MVELNATVFLQIIHFCFAWWALSTFLFKPFVHAVKNDRAYKKRLQTTLITYQDRLHNMQEQIALQWHDFQKLFAAKIPHNNSFKKISTKIQSHHVHIEDTSQKNALINEVVKTISQRITHD